MPVESSLDRFVAIDHGYVFNGRFFINGDLDCIISVIFEPEQIKHLLNNKYTVELVKAGKDFNEIAYIYRGHFIKNKSVYRRVLNRSEGRISFELIANEFKGPLPRVASSRGSYQIKPDNGGYWVEYYEECKLTESKFEKFWLLRIKREAADFLKRLDEHLQQTCHLK
ncbi:MAG: hypothetical protein H6754_02060 [Candidatus Omnitrophica bacterium]|nr:hypothetical protein [Candidatus Omnitrophota bacterium]